jgi:hypothetical protein
MTQHSRSRVSRVVLVVLLAALVGCTKGKACDTCSNVDDCEAGLSCQQFRDSSGNLTNRCGNTDPNMTCRVTATQ